MVIFDQEHPAILVKNNWVSGKYSFSGVNYIKPVEIIAEASQGTASLPGSISLRDIHRTMCNYNIWTKEVVAAVYYI